MEAPRAPGIVSDPGQLLSRQDGHTARHPDPGARAYWLAACTAWAIRSLAFTITRLDINNSRALVYICLTS